MVDAPTITPQEKERENCQRLNNKSGWAPPPKVGTANGAETVTLANVQVGRLFLAMSLPVVACERYIHVHHRLSVPASAYQRSNTGRNDSAREKPCEDWPTVITAWASFYSMEGECVEIRFHNLPMPGAPSFLSCAVRRCVCCPPPSRKSSPHSPR